MRFSQQWLAEWVDHGWDLATLTHRLTMAGLEVEGTEDLSAGLDGVVVGRIEACEPHPNADRLSLCRVDVGEGEARAIVCGATNMTAGDKVPAALPGAVLPNGSAIRKSKLRGVTSEGMLCSAPELGLGEDAEGLLLLAADAPVGEPLATYLDRDDTVVELDLTPNRGDCLSIAGVAREVAALADRPLAGPSCAPVPVAGESHREVCLEAGADCPRYLGRVVTGVDARQATPVWLAERLRRCGVRPVALLVDVTNYVMLELGQPLHAFDNQALRGAVRVRHAADDEAVTLLDGRSVALEEGTLVVADDQGVQAVAGVMGAAGSAVEEGATEVFLEAAHFRPGALAGRARKLGLHTDASHRFERGVDPELPRAALERATALLTDLAGGCPGPVVEAVSAADLPQRPSLPFRPERADERLGTDLGPAAMQDAFRRLNLSVADDAQGGWRICPPSYRFDLALEADLVEEVARLHGYDRLPARPMQGGMRPTARPETAVSDRALRRLLVDRGFLEVITYSFVDPATVAHLDPDADPLPLANPLSREQSVMRPDLLPGLLGAAAHNQAHQSERLRIFELGRVFPRAGEGVVQQDALGGLVTGPVDPPHWDGRRRMADFFDAKGDVEAVLTRIGVDADATFEAAELQGLHPGQAARIRLGGHAAGWLGALHPSVAEALEVADGTLVFQLDLEVLRAHVGDVPQYRPVPRLPVTRRDLAVVVPEAVTAGALQEAALGDVPGDLVLMDCRIFDVYTGERIEAGHKSVGLALTLQPQQDTPTDETIEAAVAAVVERLAERFGARLRG